MALDLLNRFKIDDLWLDHYIETEDDTTKFINEDTGKILVTIDHSANLRIYPHEATVGQFRLDDFDLWEYWSIEPGLHITTGNKSLIKAEMKVFKQLVNLGEIKIL